MTDSRTTIWRDRHGIAHVEARCAEDLYRGQGVVHATDRGLQLLLMRIVGQGRLAELLNDNEGSVRLDKFFRRMNWGAGAESEVERLEEKHRNCLQAYCDGVNQVLRKRYPWEFKLLRYRPDPWRPLDTIVMSRVIGYVAMQQSQAQMERLLVEMVQAGVAMERLEELFPGHLGQLDVDLVRRIRLGQRAIPDDLIWETGLPTMMASNNWALSGAKTASGKPMLCSDPHLEGNRLPNAWSEIVLHRGDRYMMGGSMPGGPGIQVGRNPDVAWGTTYAFVDAVDSWVEKCRGGKYFREPDRWLPFEERTEVILRKHGDPVETRVFENEHGVLEGDPSEEGYYLATRWAAARSGAATLSSLLAMWDVRDVEQGMETLGRLETAWNFALADRHGNIGHQMSGLSPIRREGASGLVPLAGWKSENDWRGFVAPEDLPRRLNPPEGFLATANNNVNRFGRHSPVNLCMGPHRADRIHDLLSVERHFTTDDMFRMHYDCHSLQAAQFMRILKPLLPHTTQGAILRDWDCNYDVNSEGAYLFECFYQQLLVGVLANGVGQKVARHLVEKSSVMLAFFSNFDTVLLADQSAWFSGQSRETIFRRVAEKALATPIKRWGEGRAYLMKHLLLGDKTPRVLGFNRGPIDAQGGRATICQCQVYRGKERTTVISPSFRMVADMSEDGIFTNLQGGPSDRRFSGWYCTDLQNWADGNYKHSSPSKGQPRRFP